jgi:hypothetical protein
VFFLRYIRSYITCNPPDKDTSGAKNVTLEFSDKDTVSSSTNSYTDTLYGKLLYLNRYEVACDKGEYALPSGCMPCPVYRMPSGKIVPAANCSGGDSPPVAKRGFIQLQNLSGSDYVQCSGTLDVTGCLRPGEVKFLACTPKAACQGGGNCSKGYATPDNNCVGCEKRWYKLSGECTPCPKLASLWLALYISVIAIGGVFGLILVKKGPSVAVTGVGIDYYQVLSIFIAFNIRWPAPVKDVLNIVSITNMNIELVSPECSIEFTYSQKWWVIMLAPICLVLLAIVGYFLWFFKKACGGAMWRWCGWKGGKKRSHGNLHRHANALVGGVILMFQFIYIYCTKTAFEVFACETKEDGRSYLYFEPEIECWKSGGEHVVLWPFALLFVSFYGIGIPVIFTIIVIRNRKVIKRDQVLRVLGTGSTRAENPEHYEFRKRFYKLYYRFKPRYHYWGEVILFRKFLIVLCTVFLKHNPTLQATCALMVLFISYSVHIRAMPYLRNDLLGCENIDGLDDDSSEDDDDSGGDEDDNTTAAEAGGGGSPRRKNSRMKKHAITGGGNRQNARLERAERKALALVNKNPDAVTMMQVQSRRREGGGGGAGDHKGPPGGQSMMESDEDGNFDQSVIIPMGPLHFMFRL